MNPGMGVLPLACPAACPGSGSGAGVRVAVGGRGGCGPGPGWSGRCGGRAAGRGEQVQPFVLAVPAFGQVQGEVTVAVPGGAGGDGDQVAADGRGPGLRERQGRQGPGSAEQVVRHGRDRQPGRVRGEDPGRHVSQGSAGDVGEELLHDGVAAVLPLGLDQLERGVGEDGVVAPGGEQLVLPGGGLLVQVADPADDQPRGDGLAFLRRERRYSTSATSASEIQAPSWSSQIACGYSMAVQASSPMAAIAARMLAFTGTVMEEPAPARRTAPVTAASERRSPAGPRSSRCSRPSRSADGAGGQAGRAARGCGIAAAQPGSGDHRSRDRRADGRGQRVQPPDQQRFALDLRVPEPAPCFCARRPASASSRGQRTPALPGAGQQRRLPGQRDRGNSRAAFSSWLTFPQV